MSRIKIQIYEVQTPREAEELAAMEVDRIGSVVVSEDSWRVKEIQETLLSLRATESQSSLILLFNEPDAVFRALDFYQPDIVHFCELLADKTGDRPFLNRLIRLQEAVKQRFSEMEILRSIPVMPAGFSNRLDTLQLARRFEPVSDTFLTDTVLTSEADHAVGCQPVEGFVGITGQPCDWATARMLVKSSRIPVYLAGGISPDNVYDGICRVRPAGVDSCTQTNAVDEHGKPIRFRKDLVKVGRLVAEVKRAEKALERGLP